MMKMVGHFSSQARKTGEPIVSTVYLKGNRMATVNADSIEIIDLDKETITHVDVQKKTYTVMTFEQMKQQMENARQEMEKKQAEQPAAAPPPKSDADDVKMSFDVKVRKTGAEKQVSGLTEQGSHSDHDHDTPPIRRRSSRAPWPSPTTCGWCRKFPATTRCATSTSVWPKRWAT